jgi:RimJ/RimL family protein N-acetyltransferase
MAPSDRAESFSFARMTEDDLRLLHHWFEQPHVREFYHREPRTYDEVAASYRGKILGDVPTTPYIASLAGTAIGYLQTYRLADYPEYAAAIGAAGNAAGVDMLVGEPAYAHRGLGAPLLRQFLADIVWPTTGATTCWIGPAVHNAIAIRCYARAGFVHARTVHIAGEDHAEYVMWLARHDDQGGDGG